MSAWVNKPRKPSGRRAVRRAATLLEVIVVVTVLVVLAALAIPRFSKASTGSERPDPRSSLTTLRLAVELYYHEHGVYPAQHGDGTHTAGTEDAFLGQLTRFTDVRGHVSDTKDETHRFGPYLRLGVPPCPVVPRAGKGGVTMVTSPPGYIPSALNAGWVYNWQTGAIALNSDATDPSGVPYDTY